jgi:hypothetical protein
MFPKFITELVEDIASTTKDALRDHFSRCVAEGLKHARPARIRLQLSKHDVDSEWTACSKAGTLINSGLGHEGILYMCPPGTYDRGSGDAELTKFIRDLLW